MALSIENARPEDREAVIVLLQQAELLTDDLPAELPGFLLVKEQETCVGVAGLERFGAVALLRSVAVDPQHQGRQIAAQLVERLLETAKADGLSDVYLITTTADRYFERHGFRPVDRQEVPEAIQQTQQFSDLCPSSAIVMKRTVNDNAA
ncbi:GNAT family N-acetyltransferase [Larkinella punicea]|uniref:GNAT family N-acetyltransferase n=2 Tax=Larkinella punicea TaxID=2315727 RepID=A0A368JCT3_9BACT|nr:GNAT family N-acetyltransferase [Larkinella punicea]